MFSLPCCKLLSSNTSAYRSYNVSQHLGLNAPGRLQSGCCSMFLSSSRSLRVSVQKQQQHAYSAREGSSCSASKQLLFRKRNERRDGECFGKANETADLGGICLWNCRDARISHGRRDQHSEQKHHKFSHRH